MPFLGGRGQSSRGYFGGGTKPNEPYIGTISTSINSPAKVGTPSMSQDNNNASFSWSSPGATGVALSVPFTVPSFDGGLSITDYEYSTDDGSTWKSAGTTTSPINITTVSSSSSALSSSTTYTIKLRAVNALGSGKESYGFAKTTPAQVTSYTIRVYDNYPTDNELVETITGNTSGTYSRSHYHAERDWSVTVSAVNSNGAGTYSDESSTATGWRYSSYNADYGTTRGCTTDSGCDSCGTKSGTEDGTVARTCYKWTRGGTEDAGLDCVTGGTTWQGNCRDLSGCSGSWNELDPWSNGSQANFLGDGVDWTAVPFGGGYYPSNNCCCAGGSGLNMWTLYVCSVTGAHRAVNQNYCYIPSW